MPLLVNAVEHIRPLPGASRPHLLRAGDGNCYVVKFVNNPQGMQVLANEYLANRLATRVGLPVPIMAVVAVPQELIQSSPNLRMPLGSYTLMCSSGIQFGSRLCADPSDSILFDMLPLQLRSHVRNPEAIIGAFVFDKWVGNLDRRQFIFVRKRRCQGIRAFLIDHGLCFGGRQRHFRDAPRDGLAPLDYWYKNVDSWDVFEPWIRRIEDLSLDQLREALHGLPVAWNPYPAVLDSTLNTLDARRPRLRLLIREALAAPGSPFANWRGYCPRKSVSFTGLNHAAVFRPASWGAAV